MNDIEKHFKKIVKLQKNAAKDILDTLRNEGVTITIDIINSVYDNVRRVREGFSEMESEFFKR